MRYRSTAKYGVSVTVNITPIDEYGNEQSEGSVYWKGTSDAKDLADVGTILKSLHDVLDAPTHERPPF